MNNTLLAQKFIILKNKIYFGMTSPDVDLSKLLKITEDFYIFQDQNALLGKGAFGQVYRGYYKSKNKIIAVKHIQVSEDYERQIQTLKILSTLVHPNIMGFYGYQHRNNDVYMFVQFCPNGDLTGMIKKGLTELQTLKYFRQMVEGMCYMNAKGKMHRDLKPDNILIGPQLDVKISDFGLARQTENIMITGKKGTPLYAGPEVYLSDQEGYTQRCDVWGGGLILYEMLTQQVLFKHVKTYPQLKQQWSAYQKGAKRVKYDKSLHPLWEYFTNIMLTFDPKKRPTYHEVLQILKKVYNKMEKQISTKSIEKCSNPKLQKLQNYLNFQSEKYGILIAIAEKFTKTEINVKNSINNTVMFLCLSKYLTHMKKLIRDLKHKNITLPDLDEDLIQDQNKDFELILCMDKYRNIFDTPYTLYSDQLKNKIIHKLLGDYSKRPEEQVYFCEIKEVFQLVKDANEGLFDVQDTYSEKLKQIVIKYVVQDESKLAKANEDTLKLIVMILLGVTLDTNFDTSNYMTDNYVKQKIEKSLGGMKNDLIAAIKKLKNQ